MNAGVPFSERISCTIPEACSATGLGRSSSMRKSPLAVFRRPKSADGLLIVVASLVSLITPTGGSVRLVGRPG